MTKPLCAAFMTCALTLLCALPAAGGESIVFPLEAEQQTASPRPDSEASGLCVGVLSDDRTLFTFNCTHNVANPIAGHIHRGVRGSDGATVFDLGDPTSPIQRTWGLSPQEAGELVNGGLYVNVLSTEFPPGEIRGQIEARGAEDQRRMRLALGGEQSEPPSGSDETGSCVTTLNRDNTELRMTCVHDLDDAIAAHIHEAAPGVPGPIVFDLGDGQSPIEASWEIPAEFVAKVRDGELYVNVRTTTSPAGEIRGQIDGCFADARTLCLNDNRFEVTVELVNGDSLTPAHALPGTGDSGSFWFFQPSNVELQIKVLDACTVFDRFWVFFSATTNVEFVVRVTDTASGAFKTYSSAAGEPAEPVADTDAFSTCP